MVDFSAALKESSADAAEFESDPEFVTEIEFIFGELSFGSKKNVQEETK